MIDAPNPAPLPRQAQRIAIIAQRRDGLDEQARAALEKAVTANPNDWPALLRLAHLHRRQGDLEAARCLYQRVAAKTGDAKASWLSAVLGGAALPNAPAGEGAGEGIWPAPFVRLTNFLPPERCDGLLELATANRRRFGPAMVGYGDVKPDARRGFHADRQVVRQVRPWFLPKLRTALPEVLTRVPVGDLGDCAVELKMTASLAQSDFKLHQDRNKRHPQRRLSWAYYFHRQPRRFSGGDLLLHDSSPSGDAGSIIAFTRLAPLHNSIVFFPSSCFHQMTPVEGEPDDFANCRFALNGHFFLRRSTPAAEDA